MTRRVRIAPPVDASRAARDRAAFFLEAQDGPVTSALLAREILGLRQGGDDACASILASVLAGDPRFARTAQGSWILVDPPAPPTAPPGPPLRARSWAVWAVEEELRAAAIVRIEDGRITAERSAPDDDVVPGARLSARDLARLARLAAGAGWVSWDAASLATLREHLRAGADPDTPGVIPLAGLVRAALPPPRPRALDSLARALGIVFVDPVSPLTRARLSAECLVRLLEREPLRDLPDLEALADRVESSRRGGPRTGSAPASAYKGPDHRALPAEPGVYRFYDGDGRLLYVGKARDLQRRVGSYFAVRERPDPRTATWAGSVARIEHERSGSELEALLRESEQIASRAPARNRQRTVHPRAGAPLGNLVLVQRAERSGAIRIALVRNGDLAARVVLGPRGGGSQRLRELVARLYFSDAAPEDGRRAPTARAAAARALVQSWLRRQSPEVPPLDPTDDPGPDEACARIHATAAALRRGETGIFYR